MTAATAPATDLERNKAVVRRFIDEIFLGGNFDSVDELLTEDFLPHTWGSMQPGRDGLKEAIQRVQAGISDERMQIHDIIAEGDRVAVRLTSSATHTGDFMGLPASGKRYEIGEIHIFRLDDGRVAEHWHQADFMGMMKQLGG
jgi:steroid delta-isomerase-like uncharacterized protein